jgi:Asp-tRNA(Asn)/Glu-tRNA(Gln) amidotransferase A subunit family amidase
VPSTPPPPEPLTWPVSRLVAAYRSADLSPVEVVQACLDRIDRHDGDLHAVLGRLDETALAAARAAERHVRAAGAADGPGADERPLLGVPVSVKDVFPVAGAITTYGSLVHRRHRSVEDAEVVARLRAAGAVLVATTNTSEFVASATTENLLGPDTANPWDHGRTPGGSSGGAAASVAAGMALAAVGTDGGGSVRMPAAFTGLVGIKPTHGAVTDERALRCMTPFATIGPITRHVDDARVLLGVLAGRTIPSGVPPALRIGVCAAPEARPVDPGVAAAFAAALDRLAGLGHDLVEVDLPAHGWEEIFRVVVLAEEHRERAHLLDLAPDQLTWYVRRGLEIARTLDPAEVAAAHAAIPAYRARMRAVFDSEDGMDVVVTPTVAVPAFPLGQRPASIGGRAVDRLWGPFPFTAPWNVAGLPAASVPCGTAPAGGNGLGGPGLPVGLQVAGPPGAEALLLDVCEQFAATL